MERFCEDLRLEREQRNVSIETICAVTKVSPRYVEALESGEFGELPGGVFRKGILRSYLKVLGLDEAFWVQRFEASLAASGHPTGSSGESAEDWAEFAENVRRTRVRTRPATGMRWLGIAGMFTLLALAGWLVWTLALHHRLEIAQPTRNITGAHGPSASTASPNTAAPR
ncbi:helix-turn-helix domain-containing protein [Granulicella sp. dw_53]|uniref:helix-turn-helix domain-containing protein n=1 Tax=Granulicella sp. dw_53 TaxID=2719792 RepID=UPI001BD30976|nr:helix-turn-helix domain-containing protein [Granulicella sp. dw_53]